MARIVYRLIIVLLKLNNLSQFEPYSGWWGQKAPLLVFPLYANVGIIPKNFPTFSFNSFAAFV